MAFAVQLHHHPRAKGRVVLHTPHPLGQFPAGPGAGGKLAAVERHKHRIHRSLNDPANRRRPGRQVLERLTSSLQVGSGESARFDRALAAYRKAVDQCTLDTP